MFYLVYEIFIFVFVLLSAFFCATETAIISANRMKLRSLADKGDARALRALSIIQNIEDAMGMTLIGNNIVEVASAAFITFIASKIFILSDSQIFIITTIQTILFLVFCELLPKVVARSKADAYLMLFSRPIKWLLWLLKPAIHFSMRIIDMLKDLFRIDDTGNSLIGSRDEIGFLFKFGASEGVIEKSHNDYISDILSLHDITVIEVMKPIIEIVSIQNTAGIRDLVRLIEKTRFSRIPVFENRVDNIIGFIHYRDIMNRRTINNLEDVIRRPYYVPSTKRVDRLFLEMQETRTMMAFVVNEFGGVEGLVTMEDIIEEVVGEIHTRDHPDNIMIEQIGARKYRLKANVDIDFFNREFGTSIDKKGFETLSGFLNYHFGRIPSRGDRIKLDACTIVVEEAGDRSVDKVVLTLHHKKPKPVSSGQPRNSEKK